jgi:hypothetical protein
MPRHEQRVGGDAPLPGSFPSTEQFRVRRRGASSEDLEQPLEDDLPDEHRHAFARA